MTSINDVTGRAIDLVHPVAEQVDFAAIAHALSNVNRYGGNADQTVSVALHTIIGFDLCPEPLRAQWLLHDCHEARINDVVRPVESALAAVAEEGRAGFGEVVRRAYAELRRRHDVVIYAAAGVPLPNAKVREAIEEIDRRCIATELRDFQRPPERPWRNIEGVAPAKPLRKWMPPVRAAEDLLDRFRRYLPALRADF